MGLFEVVPAGVAGEDLEGPERDLEWMGELAVRTSDDRSASS